MKHSLNNCFRKLLLLGFVLAANFGLTNTSLAAVTGTVSLTNNPLATSSTGTVKPNVLLVLDDSGSMSWDHMPDDATDPGSAVTFSYGYYGLRSSQCNQVYYDPTFTYSPPIKADGTAYSNATFTAAWTDGFNTLIGTVNLNNAFRATQSLNADSTLLGLSAYYYAYSGAQTTLKQKSYTPTNSPFFYECGDLTGGSNNAMPPVNGVKALTGGTPSPAGTGVFTKHRLATTETTTIVLTGGGSGSGTQVNSITVGSTTITSGATTQTNNTITLAGLIAAKITLGGYSATSSGSTVTITGPTSAKDLTPVINLGAVGGTTITLTADVFPDTTAANLQNFANWYSYYRTRILMMKTATGSAFASLNSTDYRVGLMQISQTNPSVPMGLFGGTQRSTWFSTLYGISPSGSTPLRQALSNAGQYYAGVLSGATDPVQYSCQQNFSILTTDGYWNTGTGFDLNGSAVNNQDGLAARPMNDGAQEADTVTTQYSQDTYTTTSTGCTGGKKKLKTQNKLFSCGVTSGVETCTTPTNNGPATTGACQTTVAIPSPNPSARATIGTPVTTAGSVGGSSDSLSDVAMYYYQTDLRPGTCTLCTDNVFASGLDNNSQQHMTTFTLGLGASGQMIYSPTYSTDNTGDYLAVKLGQTASSSVCTWQTSGTVCNWPMPGMSGTDGLIANIDDLWHAAIDGRGAYFSATNPDTLATGLGNALAAINSRKGSGAAAATSTLNPVANNNLAYVASYTTVTWQGNLEARGIDIDTGEVNENAAWCVEDVPQGTCVNGSIVTDPSVNGAATCVIPNSLTCPNGTLDGSDCITPVATACTGKMSAQVAGNTRKIWTKGTSTNMLTLNNFKLGSGGDLSATDFDATRLSGLTQWTAPAPDGLDATQKTSAVANIVNYLRGDHTYEYSSITPANQLFRTRNATLGDAVESQPAFVGTPTFSYLDSGYSAFKSTNATRSGTVYMGANDGMMHAFDASTNADGTVTSTSGNERWAYVPSMIVPNMWKLADSNYKSTSIHSYYVNGSPIISDVFDGTNWKTILVAGLNGGGRGYYAMDITNPASPVLLWEFSPVGATSTDHDANLGYSYGTPVITKLNNGTWVVLVTSGYNNIAETGKLPNITTGDGQGYLYVLNAVTGAKIKTIGTGVGSTSVPSGLAQISAWSDEPEKNNTATFVYGGDLLGNLWRFDINAAAATGSLATNFARLCSTTGTCNGQPGTTIGQPITTKPELGKVQTSDGKIHRVVFVGTGKYLENNDLSDTQQQSVYAIKDDDVVGTATPTAALVNPRTVTTGVGKMVQQTMSVITGGRAVTTTTPVNFLTDRGWFVDFLDSGERENIAPQLVLGTLIVPTTVPSSTVCEAGGTSWLNFFDYRNGGSVSGTNNNLVSVKVSAPIVGINVIYITDPTTGKLVPKVSVVTAEDPTPQLQPDAPFSTAGSGFQSKRAIWRELVQ